MEIMPIQTLVLLSRIKSYDRKDGRELIRLCKQSFLYLASRIYENIKAIILSEIKSYERKGGCQLIKLDTYSFFSLRVYRFKLSFL